MTSGRCWVNLACQRALKRFRELLEQEDTFGTVPLEKVVDALEAETGGADWVSAVRDRYFGWHKVDAALAATTGA